MVICGIMWNIHIIFNDHAVIYVAMSLPYFVNVLFIPVFTGVLGMIKAVEGFLVYHAALGQRVLQDHFNFNHTNNFMVVGLKRQDNEICSRLVEMFSRPGDWILDVNIKAGTISKYLYKSVYCNLLLKVQYVIVSRRCAQQTQKKYDFLVRVMN
jgi:hypothetical protein